MRMSEVSIKLEGFFDKLNNHLFDNKLPEPMITIQADEGRGSNGWCSTQPFWKVNDEGYYELNMCAEYLNRPFFDLIRTMVHEMVHLDNTIKEIKDVSNGNYYHNKKFKETAEAHGLVLEKDPKYGWTGGTLSESLQKWVEENLGTDPFMIYRISSGRAGTVKKPKAKSTAKRLVCPVCGGKATVTKKIYETGLRCIECDEEMEKDEGNSGL